MRRRRRLAGVVATFVAALLGAAGASAGTENTDPANDDHQFAWGENAGWINAEPSGDGGPGVEVLDFKLTGWMWGENIGWISLTCENTSSCGVTQYGVANNGFGALSGFAWSENAGWIRFDPTTCAPDPTCGVRIDPATGYFSGRAWGENIGWITFSSAGPIASTVRTGWCQATVAPPGTSFQLDAAPSGSNLLLSWSALGNAGWYDVVEGNLVTLRTTGGDFGASTSRCVVTKTIGTSVLVSGSSPTAGNGFWYLVRGANCKGRGTFDTGLPSQIGTRDGEINASANSCP
jgi:hypothetical protein